ncbi:MAG: class I SAM-dependent methyltransferase [Firmicutes bacterium]|nr:class I SAM-dependent methyltransferase [Bacillota bacterium]NBI62075.1 class I SAM-dependent methyltransferase [Clostridiales bacterium]
MDKKTEESRTAYNQIAFEYDTSREGQYTRFHIKELSNMIDLSEGDVVLDVACGNGTLLRELSKKEKIQANGIDISENMIHAAKMRCPNMNFDVKPCYPLEWSDESLDIVTVCCAFHHFNNPRGFVNECKRVLKKNGTVYIADPNFGAVIRFVANRFVLPFSKSGDVKIYSKKELKAIFYHSGFTTVQVWLKGKGLFLKAKK